MISEDLIYKIWSFTLFGKFSNTKACLNLREIKSDDIERYLSEPLRKIPTEIKHKSESEILECRRRGIKLLTIWDKDYPQNLLQIADPPLILFVRGELNCGLDSIGIVGSRRCSAYGKKYSEIFSKLLAQRSISIVSGLASGIDSAAHSGAIESENYPGVGVLGCGLDTVYPAHNHKLYQTLLLKGGAIVSEFGLYAKPRNYLFPRRNRIISGLSKAVIVIEASEQSGSLITARVANEQGRDVLALPGPIDSDISAGCNRLISQGAKIICSKQDLLDYIEDQNLGKKFTQHEFSDSALINELKQNPHTVDSLSQHLNIPLQKLYANLLTLELKGELNIDISGQIEVNH